MAGKMRFSHFSVFGLAIAGLFNSNLIGMAQSTPAQTSRAPVLVELFTSQGCSSCPPAETLFNELADTDGVVAIQWHVDYWDTLVHGRAGRWKDPYSSAANTQRQRKYNYALRRTGSVYTPQAVIGGVMETTGSHAQEIANMIAQAPASQANINITMDKSGYLIQVTPDNGTLPVNAETIMVTMLREEVNDIKAGENKGLTVSSRNIAIEANMLGAWTGTPEAYRAETMIADYTCAVIVQEKTKGRVLGASYCPN